RSGHLELIARTGSRSIRGGYGVTAALEVVDLPVPVRNRIAAPTVHSASPIDTELRFSRDHQMDEAQFHWLVGILEGEGTFIRASPSSRVAPTCVVPGCTKPHRSRGLCHAHYMLWSRDLKKGRIPRVT